MTVPPPLSYILLCFGFRYIGVCSACVRVLGVLPTANRYYSVLFYSISRSTCVLCIVFVANPLCTRAPRQDRRDYCRLNITDITRNRCRRWCEKILIASSVHHPPATRSSCRPRRRAFVVQLRSEDNVSIAIGYNRRLYGRFNSIYVRSTYMCYTICGRQVVIV